MSEKEIENDIYDYLEVRNLFPIQNQRVGIYSKERKCYLKKSNRNRPGVSDIQCCFRGRTVWFEVKTPEELKKILSNWSKFKNSTTKSHKHYREQIEFIESIRQREMFGWFVSSVREVREKLDIVSEMIDIGAFYGKVDKESPHL